MTARVIHDERGLAADDDTQRLMGRQSKGPEAAMQHPPYLSDVGVLALVPDQWETCWQTRHQIIPRLSRYFYTVWCTPAPWWRQWWSSTREQRSITDDGVDVWPGLSIYRPERYLPELGRPHFLARWAGRQRLRRAQHILLKKGCRRTALYLWRPSFAPALDLISHDLSCYHIDDEYTFSDVEQPLDPQEARLISRVDQVFIHSPALLEKKGHLNPHTAYAPNGCDYDAYATHQGEPDELEPIPRPRIGYVGRIKQQLDLPLLLALAQRHRQWSFVLVGPQESLGKHASLIPALSQQANIYFLGAKPAVALPAVTQHLDVCMLCYEVNAYTNAIYPLKLHEYLASGRPVVGSPIRSLQEFGEVVKLARTPEEWSQAIQEALQPGASSASQVEARREVARRHDWDRLVQLIARTMCERLGPQYVQRIEQILVREAGKSPATIGEGAP